MMSRRALWILLLFSGCGPTQPAPVARPAFELFPVVEQETSRLEAALAIAPAAESLDRSRAEIDEEVRGLVTFYSGASRALRPSVLIDLATFGDAAVPVLAAVLNGSTTTDAERVAAIELLSELDSVRSSAQLLNGAESGRESWLRANCAWRLGQGSQEWVVPRLVLRLKYETDGECVIWIAVTLAHFGNHAGLVGLRELTHSGADENVRTSARRELAALAQPFDQEELNRLGGAENGIGLAWSWSHWNDPLLQPELPESDRYLLEVWRLINALSEFQLRGVDDARFTLARLGPTAALCLARALHDESPYVRVHSAQALERMGARGSVAGPELVKALSAPELAPTAASALGRVAHPDAADALEQALAPTRPLGLRVAAARALGFLGLAPSVDALTPLLSKNEPIDLRQAAAQSIAYCGGGEQTAALLCEFAESDRVDPANSIAALGWWLRTCAQREMPGANKALERWNELASPAGVIETAVQTADRNRLRTALIRDFLRAE